MSNIFRRPIRGIFGRSDNLSDRSNMSILTNLSVSSRWPYNNGQINNISLLTKQICHTDQLFFQSSSNGLCYASRRRDKSACGIPALKPDSHRKIVKDYRPKTGKDHEILRESV